MIRADHGRPTSPTLHAPWDHLITGWTAWMRAAHRPVGTIDLRRYHLGRIRRWFEPLHAAELTTQDLAEFIAAHAWQKETARSYRASLRSFYGWAHAVGLVVDDPARALPSITPSRGRPRPTPTSVFQTALAAAGPRERLMLLLAAHAGLRRAEIAHVHTRDVEEDLLGFALRVHGKGDVVRRVPLTDDLARALRAAPPGWVFPSPGGGHLTPAHVGKLVSTLLPEGWTTHTLRHRFASRAYAGSRDLRAVQELLGHSKPETTARYTEVPADDLRKVVLLAVA
ncbi:tyrosine-type recombinase/integrase [Kineococcus gynurae]|uniref:Tyrosine-type recombinase/integrase n=1 Tax=Kineococcus gynurae TaxID=452979 RepID=A0ABV5LX52_9ACTN